MAKQRFVGEVMESIKKQHPTAEVHYEGISSIQTWGLPCEEHEDDPCDFEQDAFGAWIDVPSWRENGRPHEILVDYMNL